MKNRLNLQMSQGHYTTPKPKVRLLLFLLPVLLLFTVFFSGNLYSQSPIICGVDDGSSFPKVLAGPSDICFDVNTIQQSCTKVWIRINVHFFVDTDCSGTIYPISSVPYSMERAYERAE